jgi:hypothetical protein
MNRLVALWFLSLVVVGTLASAVTAQVNRGNGIITGSNIGFRLEGTDMSGKPVGTWMVRIAGEWVAVGMQVKVSPAQTSQR